MNKFTNTLLLSIVFALSIGCETPTDDMIVFDETLADISDPTVQRLVGEYGVRPRKYSGLLNNSCTAEHRFMTVLPEVTQFINERLAARGTAVRVTEAELAINFITEGGYYVLADNYSDCIDGFNALGIDTLVDNLEALRPFLHDAVLALADAGDNTQSYINERGEQVRTLSGLTVEEGLFANAGMYAWAKYQAERDVQARGSSLATLEQRAQVFWGTVYFNAGPGTGRNTLDTHGVQYYNVAGVCTDPQTVQGCEEQNYNNRMVQFNALWRTASHALLTSSACPNGDCPTPSSVPNDGYVTPDCGADVVEQGADFYDCQDLGGVLHQCEAVYPPYLELEEPILDGQSSSHTLYVEQSRTVVDLNATIEFMRSTPDGLSFVLRSPSGFAVQFSESEMSPYVEGEYVELELWTLQFSGESTNGVWTLEVIDEADLVTGSFLGMGLSFGCLVE